MAHLYRVIYFTEAEKDEKDIETCQQYAQEKNPRFSGPDGHERRAARYQSPAGKGTEKIGCLALPKTDRRRCGG